MLAALILSSVFSTLPSPSSGRALSVRCHPTGQRSCVASLSALFFSVVPCQTIIQNYFFLPPLFVSHFYFISICSFYRFCLSFANLYVFTGIRIVFIVISWRSCVKIDFFILFLTGYYPNRIYFYFFSSFYLYCSFSLVYISAFWKTFRPPSRISFFSSFYAYFRRDNLDADTLSKYKRSVLEERKVKWHSVVVEVFYFCSLYLVGKCTFLRSV